jgi:acetyltransferase-like isoleucine patch superfamily enzyme
MNGRQLVADSYSEYHVSATKKRLVATQLDGEGMEKTLFRRGANRILGMMARMAPGAESLRPFLHKLRGVQISGRVFIGDDVYLENEYPECIELHEGAQIALRSILIAHTRGPGKIVVGRDAFVGANCVVAAAPGVTLTIGEGAVIATSSVITSDVPPQTLVGNDKAKPLAKVTVPFAIETPYDRFLAGLRPLPKK